MPKINFTCFHFQFLELDSIDQANVSTLGDPKTTLLPIENLKILIEVIKSKQNNETWKLFRLLLANSTNKFYNATDIKAEKCMYACVNFLFLLFFSFQNDNFSPVKMTLRLLIRCHVKVLGQIPKIVLKLIYPFK